MASVTEVVKGFGQCRESHEAPDEFRDALLTTTNGSAR